MLYKNYIILFLLLISPILFAQNIQGERAVTKQLVDIVFENSKNESIMGLLVIDLSGNEKQAFLKDYDSISSNYYIKLERFFIKNYTIEEMRELLSFMKTPLGNKLSHDLKLIAENSIPPGNSLRERLEVLKEKYK